MRVLALSQGRGWTSGLQVAEDAAFVSEVVTAITSLALKSLANFQLPKETNGNNINDDCICFEPFPKYMSWVIDNIILNVV